jgi:hypothetical protein
VGVGKDCFRGPSVLFPGPFGNSPTLNLEVGGNNPGKNLQWAVVIPTTQLQTDYGELRQNPTPQPQMALCGKHFYSLPRISSQASSRG